MRHSSVLALTILPWLTSLCFSQSIGDVPGVVINQIPAPGLFDQLLGRARYVSDPAIVVLPNGDYLASHARFNPSSSIVSTGPTLPTQ